MVVVTVLVKHFQLLTVSHTVSTRSMWVRSTPLWPSTMVVITPSSLPWHTSLSDHLMTTTLSLICWAVASHWMALTSTFLPLSNAYERWYHYKVVALSVVPCDLLGWCYQGDDLSLWEAFEEVWGDSHGWWLCKLWSPTVCNENTMINDYSRKFCLN